MQTLNRFQRTVFKSAYLFFITAYLLSSLVQSAWAFENSGKSNSHVKNANETILKGIDLLYNLRFEEAEDQFQKAISVCPDKPAGYFYLAMVTWSRMVAGFWSPQTVREYKDRIDNTVDVAMARIDSKTKDSYDYFYLGGALGFLGRYELMKENWLSSFLVSRKAIKALKKCLKMDPNNRDVLLGLGTYDYYTARLSGVLKFLSYFLLHKGDKNEGIKKLQLAAEEAIYSGTESKSTLLHIYLFLEDDCAKALPLAKQLAEKFDQDPMNWHFQGLAYLRMEMDQEYKNTVAYMYQRGRNASSEKTSLFWTRRARYLESVYDLYHNMYPEARSKLQAILENSDPENDPAMIAWPLVKIGLTFDFEGDRETAKTYYQKVINMENGSGAQFMAEKCSDQCPDRKDPTIGY